MIVECSVEGEIQLVEPLDFRRFKLLLKGAEASQFQSCITFVDANNALVPIELIRALYGRPNDVAWERDFSKMIAKARKHGWIAEDSNSIRAHIERQD